MSYTTPERPYEYSLTAAEASGARLYDKLMAARPPVTIRTAAERSAAPEAREYPLDRVWCARVHVTTGGLVEDVSHLRGPDCPSHGFPMHPGPGLVRWVCHGYDGEGCTGHTLPM